MVTKRIKTEYGSVWGFYPTAEFAKKYDPTDALTIEVTTEQAIYLTAHPEAEWNGKEFVLPVTNEPLIPPPPSATLTVAATVTTEADAEQPAA
jgi:hypothetical protein